MIEFKLHCSIYLLHRLNLRAFAQEVVPQAQARAQAQADGVDGGMDKDNDRPPPYREVAAHVHLHSHPAVPGGPTE